MRSSKQKRKNKKRRTSNDMTKFLDAKQVEIILETISKFGTQAIAAKNAGITPARLSQILSWDIELREQVEDAKALFQDAIHMAVLERATVGESDVMLKLLAENQFPEHFKVASVPNKKKPSGLKLRRFEVSQDGEVSDSSNVTDAQIKMIEGPTNDTE